MRRRIFLGSLISLAAVAGGTLSYAAEKAARPVENITLLLDCSASMGDRFPLAASGEEDADALASTKMAEAKLALHSLLSDLSVEGRHTVGVWLYGHRLAWEGDENEPKLVEQTKYFEHTQGFQVLETLLPGDDVEVALAPNVLEPKRLPALTATLEVVEPWGEKPQFLALRQAIESQPRKGAASDRRIVLITDGGNHQGMSRFRTSKDQVLDSLRKHAVPVHIIYLGSAQDLPRQSASDFLQIARASEGQVHTVDSVAKLQTALKNSLLPPGETESAPARLEAISASAAPLLKPTTVQGRVTFYNKPVKNVEIVLKNDTFERRTKTDADGLFTFADVSSGGYSLAASVVIKNTTRNTARTVTVPVSSAQPIDVGIELK